MSASAPFRPRHMKLSVLTAALQELTPRERRDPDPDLAIEEWLEYAREIGAFEVPARHGTGHPSAVVMQHHVQRRGLDAGFLPRAGLA